MPTFADPGVHCMSTAHCAWLRRAGVTIVKPLPVCVVSCRGGAASIRHRHVGSKGTPGCQEQCADNTLWGCRTTECVENPCAGFTNCAPMHRALYGMLQVWTPTGALCRQVSARVAADQNCPAAGAPRCNVAPASMLKGWDCLIEPFLTPDSCIACCAHARAVRLATHVYSWCPKAWSRKWLWPDRLQGPVNRYRTSIVCRVHHGHTSRDCVCDESTLTHIGVGVVQQPMRGWATPVGGKCLPGCHGGSTGWLHLAAVVALHMLWYAAC